MIDKAIISVSDRVSGPRPMIKPGSLLPILIAFIPMLVLGSIGTRLGGDAPLLGGTISSLGVVLSTIVAWGVLRLRGIGWRDIGLARPGNWWRTALLGVGVLVGAVFVISAVQGIALALPGLEIEPPDISRFDFMIGNVPMLLLMVAVAWTTVAFGEEMFFRAFLINQLAESFQRTRVGWALALIGSSVAFGLVHATEGPLGLFTNGAFGLLFGAVYLGTRRRNLWITITAHGFLNTLRFVAVFAGVAG